MTCFSCIACSSADWVRGLARLISSAISNWVKTGPLDEAEGARARRAFLHHFRAGDVGGHQVGRELDAAGVQPQHDGQRLHQLGLGQARHADQKAMAARQQGDQGLLDHIVLAEDHFAKSRRAPRRRFRRLFSSRAGALASMVSASWDILGPSGPSCWVGGRYTAP